MNRIGHPDWVKLCIELNCSPNQNTFCYSSIGSNWPSLPTPSESSSPIQPGQKAISPALTSPASTWKIQQRDPEDYK